MKVVVDAFGGDNAPKEILKGSALAAGEYGVDIIFTGDREKIIQCAAENDIDIKFAEIVDCPGVITMNDSPTAVIDKHNKSSMSEAFRLLNDGADAFVSAGNTGAITVGATLITKRIPGVQRPCIASVLPSANKPFLLADCGANADCRAQFLRQFAEMGSLYMKNVMHCENPRVALANNGAEKTKGNALAKEAYSLLKNSKINFTGNIEGRQIPFGDADVVIADGFTGNLILKMYEGVAKALMNGVAGIFKKNIFTMLSALAVSGGIKDMKKQFDYKEYGGAALLGVNKCVIKAHGSSDSKAFKSAIGQAVKFVKTDLISEMKQLFEEVSVNE
ncbi:MAG: phosphate acyltransferase PlsX [Clostridiales bacterium]|nr:phosphate acyltransferase PlsX [Clostridiales bacterium]